ncbi:hypothetical protein Tco_1355264 [Tanacetum coccineum]
MTTLTPSPTPPITEAQATIVSVTDPSPTMLLRLSELEKKVEALSKVDHSEVIKESVQANVRNEDRNQLPKAVSKFFEPRLERTVPDVLKKNPPNLLKSSTSSTSIDSFTKYDLKNMLYNKMQKSGIFYTHDKHLDLFNALIGSIGLDEAIAKGEIDAAKVLKKRRHDDKDKDPSADSKKKKQKRKRKDYEPSKDKEHLVSSLKGKTQPKPSSTDKYVTAEETVHDDAIEADQPVDVKEDVVNVAD